MTVYVFDGTMDGLLTAVFDAYALKEQPEELLKSGDALPLFCERRYQVATDEDKAQRVWAGLEKRLEREALKLISVSWLSELQELSSPLFHYIYKVFKQGDISRNFADPDVLSVTNIARRVLHEQLRMKQFIRFQKAKKLTADGLAGKKTLQALEAADKGRDPSPTPPPTPKASPTPTPSSPSSKKTAKAPDGSKIYLLHWFNDIKPSLKNGQNLLVYDPSTGIYWTLRVYSRGRHCDAEPLTKKDTENMVKAFGGQNTWTQKGVYVKLPSGTWTIGSTHDMPHMSGSVKDNDFDGHLCVHFLRDMSEAQKNDPSYGVANQETIRKLWKSLTGEEITN